MYNAPVDLCDLEIYALSKEISHAGWEIYGRLDWRIKKVIGDQFISAMDSVGANIAEGFGRFHFADKNRFNYNARGSLSESLHWLDLLFERNLIEKSDYYALSPKMKRLMVKINNYITVTKEQNSKKWQ